jgi:hypothetical protein
MAPEPESDAQERLAQRYPAPPGRPSFEFPTSVLHREVDRQMVLLNVEREEYFGLDEVGTNIVTRVTRQPLAEAFAALLDDYDVDAAVLQRDLDDLVEALMREGLLRRTGPA